MIAKVILAELAGGIAQIVQELGEGRRAGRQIRNGARQLRQHHPRAVRMHSGEEGRAPGRAARLGVVSHEYAAFLRDAIYAWCFPDHQAAMIAARLHPADIIAHDEQDICFLVLRMGRNDRAKKRSRRYNQRQAIMYHVSFHVLAFLLLFGMKFKQVCGSKTFPVCLVWTVRKWSLPPTATVEASVETGSPCAPPAHHGSLVHLSGHEVLVAQLPGQP